MKNIKLIVTLALFLLGIYVAWEWIFCRFYVPPGSMAVVIAKEGKSLPPGQILAQKGQKGVQEDVLGEGRYFLNPWLYEHRIEPCLTILPGKVGVVTAKVGADLPSGDFIANRGEKGIWKGVLGPGRYRLNPYGYSVEMQDAISIPIGYVGVATSLSGTKGNTNGFADAGEKGIRGDILQPGLYFVNPKEFKIDVLEVGMNQVSMQGKAGGAVITKQRISSQNRAMDELNIKVLENQTAQREDYIRDNRLFSSDVDSANQSAPHASSMLSRSRTADSAKAQAAAARPEEKKEPAVSGFELNQFVEFPSRDGFAISLDMTVEFELLPNEIPTVFRDYGDLPAVVEKVIIPQILSISRLKGSGYRAIDFVIGEGRETFQTDLTESLRKSLRERHVAVHNALIRHVNVPDQILQPIQQSSVAQEQNQTNQEKQNTARKQAELNTELSLIEQRGAEVAQETAKLKAEIKASQEKQVAEIQADTVKQVALIDKETALLRATKVTTLGKARAETVTLVEGERAKGLALRTQALGDAAAYNMVELANALNNDVKINLIHAGPGTLWTDLQKASLGELGGAALLQSSGTHK